MKKFITVCAALLIGATALFAQNPYEHAEQWNVSVTGGGLFSGSENYFSYKENGRFYDLINWQGAFSVGYDFSNVFGTRLWVGYGKNAGNDDRGEKRHKEDPQKHHARNTHPVFLFLCFCHIR